MKFISVFSIAVLSVSVWGLFLILFNYSSEPEFQVESSINEKQSESREEVVKNESEQSNDTKQEKEDSNIETLESDESEEESEISQEVIEEKKPETLVERASSRYNDILYNFEKDHPVSIDDLLTLFTLNE